MDTTRCEPREEEQVEGPSAKRSAGDILVALRRAAGGLDANLREAARLLGRAGSSPKDAA